MIFSPTLVTATAQTLAGSAPREGLGRVERRIGPATYVIAIGREKMTVQVTSGSLKEGQIVGIEARGGGLSIHAMDAVARESGKTVPDAFLRSDIPGRTGLQSALDNMISVLSSKPSDSALLRQVESLFSTVTGSLAAIDPKATDELGALLRTLSRDGGGDRTVSSAVALLEHFRGLVAQGTTGGDARFFFINKMMPDALYAFSNVADALRFLGIGETAEAALAARLAAAIEAAGTVIVRITACGPEQAALALLRQGDVVRELASWNAASSSRVFQSIPVAVLEQLFLDRGNVPLHALRALDAFAAAENLPAASERAGSRGAQEAALLQWLRAAVDSRAAPSSLAPLAPVFSSSSIIDGLGDATAAAGRRIGTQDSFGLTAEGVRSAPGGAALWSSMIAGMGFDLEQRLASGRMPDSAGLKQLLLQLVHALDRAEARLADGGHSPGVAALKTETGKTLASMLEQSIVRLLPDTGSALTNTPALSSVISDLPARLMQQSSALWAAVDQLAGDARQLGSGFRGADDTTQQPLRKQTEAFVRDALAKLDTLWRQTVDTLLRTARPYLSALVGQTRTPESLLSALAASMEKGLDALFGKADGQENALARNVETLLRQIIRDATAAHQVTGNKSAPAGGDTARQASAAGTEGEPSLLDRAAVRQNLETLISRLESQQLLARQTPTASGEQQIIALPVKIGDEWTEMHVRFVKQRAQATGNRGHFRVFVNVAPALLGAIEARLDYEHNRSLSIGIDFESAATYAWFCAQKNDLREAIGALGVPSPHLELFRPRSMTAGADAASAHPLDGTTIDLKA
jgi:hypothetical protein